jgi:hypothetical protein
MQFSLGNMQEMWQWSVCRVLQMASIGCSACLYPPVYPYFALITLPGTVHAGQYCQYRQYFPAFRHAKNFSAPGKPYSPLKVASGIRTALQPGPAGKEQPEYLLRFRQMLTATSLASIRLGMQGQTRLPGSKLQAGDKASSVCRPRNYC